MSHACICVQKDAQTYELWFSHKKHSELSTQNRFFGLVTTPARLTFWSLWRSYGVVSCVHHTCLWRRLRPDVLPTHYCVDVVEGVPRSNLQKFTSRDVSKVGCMFSQENNVSRRFFYVDNTNFQVHLREILKICAKWRVYGSVFWVLTKSNRRTHIKIQTQINPLTLLHLYLLLLVRLGGYIVNLCDFYSYRPIGKLTVFLQLQEFSLYILPVDSSTSTVPCSLHNLKEGSSNTLKLVVY
jgi:hypothetical protein